MKLNRQKEKPEFRRVGECLYRWSHNGHYYFKGKINGREYNCSLGTTDLATARLELGERRKLLGRLDYSRGSMTLLALTERYRRTFAHQASETKAQKERILRRIEKDWPTGPYTPVGKIRPSDCNLWLAAYDFGPSSRNGHTWFLKDLFSMAVRDKALAVSPAEHLRSVRRKDPVRLTPTPEQFEAIISSVRLQRFNGHGSQDSADFLEAQGLLGLGQAEISALTRQDVDFTKGHISVLRRKTSRRFVIPLYPQARELLEKVCRGKQHNVRLFPIGNAKKALAAACNRLGLPAFSQRSLRRMFCSKAIELGVDVKVVAEWQGHRDGGALILKTYSHVHRPHSLQMSKLMV
jgi:integrase